MKEYKIGLVAAEFNYEVTMLMIERAKAEADFLGVKIVKEIKVPGVFEIPLAVKRMLEKDDVDAVITIGAVIMLVFSQELEAGTEVPAGTVITVRLGDTTVRD